MISKLFRPVIEGFKGVIRHGAMSLSSIFSVLMSLILISMMMIFTFNVRQFTQGLEHSIQIAVTVDYDHESAEEEDRISLAIKDIEGVSTVTYSSKADELEYYIESVANDEAKALFEPYREEGKNPMHDAFYVEVSDGSRLEQITAQIKEIPGVEEVEYGGASATKLVSALNTVRLIGAGLTLALSLLALFLIANTINTTIENRADELAIMRNVGAKNSFIRNPFLIEGIIIGILGSLVPIAATYFGYRYLYQVTGGHLVSDMFMLLDPDPFARYLCLALLGVGVLVGLLGSYISVTRRLRWKR